MTPTAAEQAAREILRGYARLGGLARAKKLTPEQRSAGAAVAGRARQEKLRLAKQISEAVNQK